MPISDRIGGVVIWLIPNGARRHSPIGGLLFQRYAEAGGVKRDEYSKAFRDDYRDAVTSALPGMAFRVESEIPTNHYDFDGS